MSKKQLKKEMYQTFKLPGPVTNDVKTFVYSEISKLADLEIGEISFPASFTNCDRAFVHNTAKKWGLKSTSSGKEPNRFVTVIKDESFYENAKHSKSLTSFFLKTPNARSISLQPSSIEILNELTSDNFCQTLPLWKNKSVIPVGSKDDNKIHIGKPVIPSMSKNVALQSFRKTLPIWSSRSTVLNAIHSHTVVIISGETGCGKTTQVPQFIMEDAAFNNAFCRIFCSMPRRVAATSVSERVAMERNQVVGNEVGYRIRFESRESPNTVLTFCTTGVLLRCLLSGDSLLSTVTHIIMDEIHERDKLADFTLTYLKEVLPRYPKLKLILMSATIDTEKFAEYFKNVPSAGDECPVISVSGRMFRVEEFYLEDILTNLSYMTEEFHIHKERQNSKQITKMKLEAASSEQNMDSYSSYDQPYDEPEYDQSKHKEEVDECLSKVMTDGSDEAFTELVQMLKTHNITVDYQHSKTGTTPLMAAISYANLDIAETLLKLGAKLNIKSFGGSTALDYAKMSGNEDIINLTSAYLVLDEIRPRCSSEETEKNQKIEDKEEEKKELVEFYEKSKPGEVDINLILELLLFIHGSKSEGAVLVFLPGYDTIMSLKERIYQNMNHFDKHGALVIFLLHSRMQSLDQKKVFSTPPRGTRKIILSTNIAETSVTVSDVGFVIDCGKVKMNSFSGGAFCLKCELVSQACAKQRCGRAGRSRNGLCFHLFPSWKFQELEPFKVPEILREPLEEICLQIKKLVKGVAIEDFLGRCIDPPTSTATQDAVQLLKVMSALDANEELTHLGNLLLKIPTEPKFSKMIIYAIVLKCLDPVLTIICCQSSGEPFRLPSDPQQKSEAAAERNTFSHDTKSDHMAFLQLYKSWERSNNSRNWCDQHFANGSTLQAAKSMKLQIMSHLKRLDLITDNEEVNINSEKWPVVKAALTAGLYPNIARVEKKHLCTEKNDWVKFHQSSVLRGEMNKNDDVTCLPSDWILYDELRRTGTSTFICNCTVVSPITVALFAGPMSQPDDTTIPNRHPHHDNISSVTLDSRLWVLDNNTVTDQIYNLRVDISTMILNRWRTHKTQYVEERLQRIVYLLESEDNALGLRQPSKIEVTRNGFFSEKCTTSWRNKQTESTWRKSPFKENQFHSSYNSRKETRKPGSWRERQFTFAKRGNNIPGSWRENDSPSSKK